MQSAVLAAARAGLAVLQREAAAEPFNVLLARERALGAQTLAATLDGLPAPAAPADAAAKACALASEATLALEALAAAGKLPATVVAQRDAARRQAAGCRSRA